MHTAKSFFAECQNKGTRQNTSLPSARKKHSAKTYFAVCFCLPSVFYLALGKHGLCRVPDKIHSAKPRHSANRRFPVVIVNYYGKIKVGPASFFCSPGIFIDLVTDLYETIEGVLGNLVTLDYFKEFFTCRALEKCNFHV